MDFHAGIKSTLKNGTVREVKWSGKGRGDLSQRVDSREKEDEEMRTH